MDTSYDRFMKSINFERIKSNFENSSRWQSLAGMHWSDFENMKWLIAEVEQLWEEVKIAHKTIDQLQKQNNITEQKAPTCGTCQNCKNWAMYPSREVGWCNKGHHYVETYREHSCDIDSWEPKKPEPKLPEQLPFDNPSTFHIRKTMNAIIDYLKAKEEDV